MAPSELASRFTYRAARQDGSIERGSMSATSRDAVSDALASRGLFPTEITGSSGRVRPGRRMRHADVATGLRILSELVSSGLPIARALGTMEEMSIPGWTAVLPDVRESVRGGKGLTAALEETSAFPDIVIGLVLAGERGSGLASAIQRAAEVSEQSTQLRAAVLTALAYPTVLAVAGAASVALMVGIVLPRFAALLLDLGQTLPASTRIVLQTAAVLQRAALPSALIMGCAGAAWHVWTSGSAGRTRWHELLLSMPLVRGVRLAGATSHVLAALAALLEAGVPMAAALTHASRATGDAAVTERLLAARQLVIQGQRLSRALADTHAVTAGAIRLIRAGEDSGNLPSMLARGSQIEYAWASRALTASVRIIEPALVISIGMLIAGVAAALLQAVYSIRPVT